MAHKTFISYKWSEAQSLRDKIIKALGDDATYYKGETRCSLNVKAIAGPSGARLDLTGNI